MVFVFLVISLCRALGVDAVDFKIGPSRLQQLAGEEGRDTANDRALWYSVNIRRIGSHDPGTVKEIVLVFSQARYQINRLLRRAIYPSSLLYTP